MKTTNKVVKCYVNGGEVKTENATRKFVSGLESTMRKSGLLPDTWRTPDDSAPEKNMPVRRSINKSEGGKSVKQKIDRIDNDIEVMEGTKVR